MRPSGRANDALRPGSIEPNVSRHAEGSCLIRVGDTHVLCTASLEETVPPFLRKTGLGREPVNDRFVGDSGEPGFHHCRVPRLGDAACACHIHIMPDELEIEIRAYHRIGWR